MGKSFKYKVGMYGGSFDPLHIGHLSDIIRAAGECEELYVMVSWCTQRDSIPCQTRCEWITETTKHLPNVKIITVEDTAPNKDVYNSDKYWEDGAADIKRLIGKKIDAVYCGTDYLDTGRFESLYGDESVVIYFDRAEIPISSTDIRTWATKHWDYIPSVCKPYYCRRVLVIGSESTGKSTLVRNLALAYNTNYVPEIGRETCERAGGEEFMTYDDLEENVIRQYEETEKLAGVASRILFVDTDALTTLFYGDFLLKNEDERQRLRKFAEETHLKNRWDLVLYMAPDCGFVQDGTRNELIREERTKFDALLSKVYDDHGVSFHRLTGDWTTKFNSAKKLIEQELHITTDFK